MVKLAIPLILSSAGLTLMHLADSLMLSWHSSAGMAAAGTAGMCSWLIVCFFIGLLHYTSDMTANYVGAGAPEHIGDVIWQGNILALICGLGLIALYPLFPVMFSWFGHAPDLQTMEIGYFRIVLLFYPFHCLQCSLTGFFSGRGDNHRLMASQLAGQVTNIVLDYALIFGKLGLPRTGINGAAWATGISQIVSFAILLAFFFSKQNRQLYRTASPNWRSPVIMRNLLRFGIPTGIRFFVDSFVWTLLLVFIGRLGTVELTASNIAFRINSVAFLPLIGLTEALRTMAGKAHGRQDHEETIQCMFIGTLLCQIWMGLVALSYFFFSNQYYAMFKSQDPAETVSFQDICSTGVIILRFVAVNCFFDGINMALISGLQAVGDTQWTTKALSIAAGLLTVALVLTDYLHGGIILIWLWASLYIILIAPVWILRIRSRKWEAIKVAEV
jgi:MATE family multidrug resistance protein